MTVAINMVLGLLLVLVFVPGTVFFVQTVCALLPRSAARPPAVDRPRVAVLVPAHDESAGIAATLASLFPQLEEGDRLLVVADNCSDDTVRIAAAAGAEVVERKDPFRRGKGYALDFGIRHLAKDAPQVVVIVDADCFVAWGSIDRIARLSLATDRPIQALYLIKSHPSSGGMTSIAEFACLVKNLVRPLGFHRLHLPCQLMGSGMAIPWRALTLIHLASSHIVEDIKMGVDLARAGMPPLFCPDALVESYFPVNQDGSQTQRIRWEHGHLSMIAEEAPRLLIEGLKGKGSGLFALALDICVPPLALFGLMTGALVIVTLIHAMITGSGVYLTIASGILAMFIVAVALAWLRFGHAVLSLSGVLLAFVYMLRKIPVYVEFVVRRQAGWVRTKRDGG
jgi:cellulose synthase/poly-beta-1,6-N-acetylglucosamine synthase-like glycosyltransferase